MKRTRKRGWLMVVAVGVLFSGVGLPGAEGSIMEFTFTGEITSISFPPPAPWDGIAVGSTWSVSYVFDSLAPDQAPQPWFGAYDLLQARVTIDGITQTTNSGLIEVDLINSPVADMYAVRFFDLPIGGSGEIRLQSSFLLDSDALLTDITLSDWFLSQGFGIAGGGMEFAGSITTFSSRIVPAPGVLFPLALMGMFSFRGRPRKRRR